MKWVLALLLFFSLFFCGCPFLFPPQYRFIYLQPLVKNLHRINTAYDEFNAAAPPGYYGEQELLFSTNAYSQGEQLDIYHTRVTIEMHWHEEALGEHTFSLSVTPPVPFLEVNSSNQEYGPSLFHRQDEPIYLYSTHTLPPELIYVLASDRPTNGIHSSNIYLYTAEGGLQSFAGNSPAHDYYPTYHPAENTLYFCSDRDGSFQLYAYQAEGVDNLEDLLTTPGEARLVEVLNSPANDKCPFIFQDILVFVSDREGPFNIYFSRYVDGDWISPRPLPREMGGEEGRLHLLNSDYHEYRPILFQGWAHFTTENMIMIFSSDRPGGMGGYDLYLAVLPLDIFD